MKLSNIEWNAPTHLHFSDIFVLSKDCDIFRPKGMYVYSVKKEPGRKNLHDVERWVFFRQNMLKRAGIARLPEGEIEELFKDNNNGH